ncbi:MAG TPA: methyltransferase domain-containing protein [Rubrivivax sp.]|nr:methyltransferase domain-containing protein [Rubrivivax sp.]
MRRAPGDANFVDVRQLIEQLSHEDLLRSADDYFARMTPASEQCRKPFSNPADAVHLTRHLALVLEAADLFRQARVLDFGCATGWLTMDLVQMGCRAVGVDISPAAIRLAQAGKSARGAAAAKAEFLVYDGRRLPLPDASVDRIICFDAFHHVRDQRAAIFEFARVLKDGGRVACMEPGPHHSRTPQSQMEMAQFKVIENDVSMPDIARHAADAGLDRPQMVVQFQRPFVVDVGEFNAWDAQGVSLRFGARMWRTLDAQLTDGQCFYMLKGQPSRDSRSADGLEARLTLRAARRASGAGLARIELEVLALNSGNRHWITAAMPGQVNLGVHLLSAEGRMIDHDYARLRLPQGPVAPGQELLIRGTVPLPQLQRYRLQLDLVAEEVSWFAAHRPGGTLEVPAESVEPA